MAEDVIPHEDKQNPAPGRKAEDRHPNPAASHLQGDAVSSLARFLRTQQCARTHPTPAEVAFPLPHPPHPEKGEKKDAGGTSDPAEPDHPISQCSTNERAVRETNAHDHDMNPGRFRDRGRCSLERR